MSTAMSDIKLCRTTVAPDRSRRHVPDTARARVERERLGRRRATPVVAVVFVLALTLGAGSVLASRGGDPASTPATRPAAIYVVQPGDTLWDISAEFHGRYSRSEYVDRLIDVNGGTELQIGQLVLLP